MFCKKCNRKKEKDTEIKERKCKICKKKFKSGFLSICYTCQMAFKNKYCLSCGEALDI